MSNAEQEDLPMPEHSSQSHACAHTPSPFLPMIRTALTFAMGLTVVLAIWWMVQEERHTQPTVPALTEAEIQKLIKVEVADRLEEALWRYDKALEAQQVQIDELRSRPQPQPQLDLRPTESPPPPSVISHVTERVEEVDAIRSLFVRDQPPASLPSQDVEARLDQLETDQKAAQTYLIGKHNELHEWAKARLDALARAITFKQDRPAVPNSTHSRYKY